MILSNQIPDRVAMSIEQVGEGTVYVQFTVKAQIPANEIQDLYDILNADFITIRDGAARIPGEKE